MKAEITKITFGLRHRRLFRFLSSSGSIVDELISLQGSGDFPEECFSRIGWTPEGVEFRLSDDEETFTVVCNYDGIIFTCDMEAEPKLKLRQTESIFSLEHMLRMQANEEKPDLASRDDILKLVDLSEKKGFRFRRIYEDLPAGFPCVLDWLD